jgi:hypothetical protein
MVAERDYKEPEDKMCRQGIGDQGHAAGIHSSIRDVSRPEAN